MFEKKSQLCILNIFSSNLQTFKLQFDAIGASSTYVCIYIIGCFMLYEPSCNQFFEVGQKSTLKQVEWSHVSLLNVYVIVSLTLFDYNLQ